MEFASKTGQRKEEIGEMMWEAEWYEFAKTAKAGYLSKVEAEAGWQAWMDDAEHPKDENGPRGYIRCLVKVKDIMT